MHKIGLVILGLVLIILACIFAAWLIIGNVKIRPVPQKVVKTVFVDTVQNGLVPITIEAKGNLVAKRRVELFSEVQGVLKSGSKLFKPGQAYQKGSVLLRINADEYFASVKSQKSALINQITGIMPDLRLDYPEAYTKWQVYLNSIDVNKTLPKLPEVTSEKERYFLSGRNIFTSFYNVKNLEQRLVKYNIKAPFTGILTQALVTEGTLIRPGQKLGEFIDTGSYELEVAINKSYADLLQVGKTVLLKNLDKTKEYKGVVSRINGNVDVASQTINAYIEVKDNSLREGIYLEAMLDAREEDNAIMISRNLLQPNDQVFAVKDSILTLVPATPVYYTDKSVVLKDIPNETVLIKSPVPGAYSGMLVKIFKGDKPQDTKKKVSSVNNNS
ncbi:HlyD family efflux transporter periplasmic adaptor subunit [Spongiivirga citrea]|uniref:HlyD family efflux transporter periplasmic adaptor subunit n=1 Tax=Spongiivirga citrea TaxID=1481457 RepID=A0A6M0CMA0_9FLAO|nr:HlyD family efflux transporter periplasmic adaptor subunit [Spongiivirga citrea]